MVFFHVFFPWIFHSKTTTPPVDHSCWSPPGSPRDRCAPNARPCSRAWPTEKKKKKKKLWRVFFSWNIMEPLMNLFVFEKKKSSTVWISTDHRSMNVLTKNLNLSRASGQKWWIREKAVVWVQAFIPDLAMSCRSLVSLKDELVHPCHNSHSLKDRNLTSGRLKNKAWMFSSDQKKH